VSERKMFGGIAFMVAGNMACGILGDELIVRVGTDDADRALAEDGVREFDFTGKPVRSTVFVSADVIADDDALAEWVDTGASFASSLPPK
jgi:TfoX/Sxy family transcriptional regulator of competence genes